LKTRRVVHIAVARSPTDVWAAQQLREAALWGEAPKYLIHDRDSKYGQRFLAVAASSGIKELKTPFRDLFDLSTFSRNVVLDAIGA
jgi:hypothetical protein